MDSTGEVPGLPPTGWWEFAAPLDLCQNNPSFSTGCQFLCLGPVSPRLLFDLLVLGPPSRGSPCCMLPKWNGFSPSFQGKLFKINMHPKNRIELVPLCHSDCTFHNYRQASVNVPNNSLIPHGNISAQCHISTESKVSTTKTWHQGLAHCI